MANLETEFAGIKLQSPFGLAPMAPYISGAPEKLGKLYLRSVSEGAGYIYTPFICSERKRGPGMKHLGRFMRMELPGWGKETLLTLSSVDNVMYRLEEGITLIRFLRKNLSDNIPIIAGITSPWDFDGKVWVNMAKEVQNAGADMIELDVSCPLPASELKQTAVTKETNLPAGLLADTPELLAPIVHAVAENVDMPIGVKLTPESGFPRLLQIAAMTKREGAKFVTTINSPLTVAPPDIYNRGKPLFQGFESVSMAGMHGPANRYICYKHVATISKFVPGIDVAAVGGLVQPQHMIEAMMLGAKIVEFASGMLWNGVKIVRMARTFLEQYMSKQGYNSIQDFRGLGLQYIVPTSQVKWPSMIAQIDKAKCKGCKICADNLCWAMTYQNEGTSVDTAQCSGCGLCASICPSRAIILVPKPQTPC